MAKISKHLHWWCEIAKMLFLSPQYKKVCCIDDGVGKQFNSLATVHSYLQLYTVAQIARQNKIFYVVVVIIVVIIVVYYSGYIILLY